MRIAVDAFGGDNAPDEVIKGAVQAVRQIVGNRIQSCKLCALLPGSTAILDIGNLVRLVGKEQMDEVSQPPGGLVDTAVACVAASLQCLLQIRQCAELMFVRCKRNAVVPRFMAQCKRFS